jgi:uncharacterized RDD family membrane protein YckC
MASCPHCGVPYEIDDCCTNPECPEAEAVAAVFDNAEGEAGGAVVPSGSSDSSLLVVPRPPLVRRLGGSALEYVTLIVVEIIGTLLMGFTFGASGAISSLIGAIYMSVKDLDGGRFSFGKRAVGTRVVDVKTLQRVSAGKAFLRNLPWVLAWLIAVVPVIGDSIGLPLIGLLALLDVGLIAMTPTGRRLGDFLAGTQVVPEERA